MRLLATGLIVAALLATYTPARAHKAPSTCNIVVTKTSSKSTLTEVWVGHINDGDSLTAKYTDVGKAKTKPLGKGTTYLGTNVTGVSVRDKNDKKVC